MDVFRGWTLRRNPLASSVPLDGSDTVQGLQELERLRSTAGSWDGSSASSFRATHGPSQRRRKYRRFKGPYVEQLTFDDLKKAPRSWNQFSGLQEADWTVHGYSVPATLDLLCERLEENASYYVANYVRMAFAVVVLTLYLRPRAVIGVIALCISIGLQLRRAMGHQRTGRENMRANASTMAPETPTEISRLQGSTSTIVALLTWILVAYSRCIPILLLGVSVAALAIIMHAGTRQAPSEDRYRGREKFNYSLGEVLGWRSVAPNSDPRLVFKQVWSTLIAFCKVFALAARRWAWDVAQRPLSSFGGIYRL